MSTTTANLGLFKYDTTNPTDLAAAFNINQALNNNWDIIDNAVSHSGSARNIGEIVASTIPLTDAGLHLLDGALIQGSGVYADFVDYIADLYNTDVTNFYQWKVSNTSDVVYTKSETPSIGDILYNSQGDVLSSIYSLISVGNNSITVSYNNFPMEYLRDSSGDFSQPQEYFTDETSWQSSVSTYGVCGKFVYDSVNNTVRLPKYNSKIYTGGGTAPVVGNGMTLGLTNGTANFGMCGVNSNNIGLLETSTSVYGESVGSTNINSGRNNFNAIGVTTDSTKSGILADLSGITTSLDGYYYIVVATSTKTDIQVDIDEITTDLNGKADTDLSNVPNSKGILTESYKNGTSWYRVYADGWCEQGGLVNGTSVTFTKTFASLPTVTVGITTLSGTNSFNCNTAKGYFGNNLSTTGFDCQKLGQYWQACGYIR